jgi:hypothetical protein
MTAGKPPRHKQWVSTKRRVLASFGVTFSPEYNAELDALIWGSENIGAVIGRNGQQTYRLLYARVVDATQVSLKQEA